MLYLSTRNNKIEKTASQAVLEGLAKDGGLYMPKTFEGTAFPMENLAKNEPKGNFCNSGVTPFCRRRYAKGRGQ